MDSYMSQLIDECDLELSQRLKNILSVKNLVDVRCDFEQRLTNYYDSNIKE